MTGINGGAQNTGRPTAAHGPLAILVGHQEPVTLVHYEEPDDRRDSGFILVMADRVDDEPDEVPIEDMRPVCLGCAIDTWPSLQTAMHIARTAVDAELDDAGRWQPG